MKTSELIGVLAKIVATGRDPEVCLLARSGQKGHEIPFDFVEDNGGYEIVMRRYG